MGRILAIDYGKKRCGIAVSDPQKIIANPLLTVDTANLFSFLEQYFKDEIVEQLVVGYPLQKDGTPSEIAKDINAFCKKFQNQYDIPVELENERFTSKMAFQSMIDGGLKKKKRQDKALIDKVSASIILQSYMQRIKNSI